MKHLYTYPLSTILLLFATLITLSCNPHRPPDDPLGGGELTMNCTPKGLNTDSNGANTVYLNENLVLDLSFENETPVAVEYRARITTPAIIGKVYHEKEALNFGTTYTAMVSAKQGLSLVYIPDMASAQQVSLAIEISSDGFLTMKNLFYTFSIQENRFILRVDGIRDTMAVGVPYNYLMTAIDLEAPDKKQNVSVAGMFTYGAGRVLFPDQKEDTPVSEKWEENVVSLPPGQSQIQIKVLEEATNTASFFVKDAAGNFREVRYEIIGVLPEFQLVASALTTDPVSSLNHPIPFVIQLWGDIAPENTYTLTAEGYGVKDLPVSAKDTVLLKFSSFGEQKITFAITDKHNTKKEHTLTYYLNEYDGTGALSLSGITETIKDFNHPYNIPVVKRGNNEVTWKYTSNLPISITKADGTPFAKETEHLLYSGDPIDWTSLLIKVDCSDLEAAKLARTGKLTITTKNAIEEVSKDYAIDIPVHSILIDKIKPQNTIDFNSLTQLPATIQFSVTNDRKSPVTMEVEYDNTFGTFYYADRELPNGSSVTILDGDNNIGYKPKKEGTTPIKYTFTDVNGIQYKQPSEITNRIVSKTFTSSTLNTTYYNGDNIYIDLSIADTNPEISEHECKFVLQGTGKLIVNGTTLRSGESFKLQPNETKRAQLIVEGYGDYKTTFTVEDWRGAVSTGGVFTVPCRLTLGTSGTGKGAVTTSSGNGKTYKIGENTKAIARENGSLFRGWYDKAGQQLGTNTNYDISFDGDKELYAKFDAKAVKLEIFPEAATDSATGAGEYTTGAEVRVSTSTTNPLRKFSHWEDAFTHDKLSTSNPYTFMMPGTELALRPIYTEEIQKIRIDVSYDSRLGNIDGAGVYDINAQAILKATPQQYCKFVGWFDKNETLLSTQPEYKINLYTAEDIRVTAKFEQISWTLSYSDVYYCDDLVNSTIERDNSTTKELKLGEYASFTPNEKDEKYTFMGYYDSKNNLLSKDPAYRITETQEGQWTSIAAKYVLKDITITVRPYGGWGGRIQLDLVSNIGAPTNPPARMITIESEKVITMKYGTKYKMTGDPGYGSVWQGYWLINKPNGDFLVPAGKTDPKYDWIGWGGVNKFKGDPSKTVTFYEDTYVGVEFEKRDYKTSFSYYDPENVLEIDQEGTTYHGNTVTYKAVINSPNYKFVHFYDLYSRKILSTEPVFSYYCDRDMNIEVVIEKIN